MSPEPTGGREIVLTVVALAPSRLDVLPGRSAVSYGPAARDWTPYRHPHRFPVAAYVADALVVAGVPRRRIALSRDAGRLFERVPSLIDLACAAYRGSPHHG